MDKHNRYRPVPLRKNGRVAPEKKRVLQNRLLVIFIFFVILWGLHSFIRSDFFVLDTLDIEGNLHTPEAEIRLAMQVHEGLNVWDISPSQLKKRVENIPRIEFAEIHRRLPRSLYVEIQEKKVMALVPYREYLLEVGVDGQILGTTQDPQNFGLPLLTGIAPVELKVGEYLLWGEQLASAAAALSLLDETGPAVSELNVSDPENFIIITLDGLVVWLGQTDFVEKINILTQISAQIQGKQTDGYLDLRVKDAPAFHITTDKKTQKNN